MTNYRIVVLAAIILIIIFAGAYFIYQKQVGNQSATGETSPSPTPEALTLPSPSPAQTSKGPQVLEQPQSGSDTVEVKNAGIKITSPQASSIITSPIIVAGQANVLGKIEVNIKDGTGKVLGSGQAQACLGYDACPFQTTISFANPSTQAGTIEIWTDDSSYLQQILIRFN